MAPNGTTVQGQAAEEGLSSAPGEREEEGTLNYTTEDFVRRAVGGLFRGEYAGKFLCSPCLVKLVHQRMQRGWRTSEIERSMDAVLKSSGALMYMPTFLCARCANTLPGLGAPRR